MKDSRTFSIVLPVDLYNQLAEIAKVQQRTVSAQARWYLKLCIKAFENLKNFPPIESFDQNLRNELADDMPLM